MEKQCDFKNVKNSINGITDFMIDLILAGLLQSMILALITYGVMIPFKLLNFPDLSAEGAYPLGGAVFSVLLTNETNIVAAMVVSAISTGLMSLSACIVSIRFRVNSLLAGIILSNIAYSINLHLIGKPNISLFHYESIISQDISINLLMIALILLLTIVPIMFFLYTDFGLRLRAVGLNANFAQQNGINVSLYKMLGLFIAGGFFGIAGSLMVQIQSYMDIGMGSGIIVHALASLLIGEAITNTKTLKQQFAAPLIGAIIYQQIQGIALFLGLQASDLRLFTGVIVLLVIATTGNKNRTQFF